MSETIMSEQSKTSRECALIAARAADERKATDIMVIKVGELVDVTDYFVIATGANTPQVEAILDNIEEALRKEAGVKPASREATNDHWITARLWLIFSSLKRVTTIVSKCFGVMLPLSI